MGKSKSNNQQPIPQPAQPTSFQYVNADNSNTQQRQAAINSTTNDTSSASSFGSELGSSTASQPMQTPTMGAV